MSLAWIALFLAGSGASLLLIHAGRSIGYQHYPPLDRLLSDAPRLALLLVGVQTVAVLAGLWRQRALVGQAVRGVGGRVIGLTAVVMLLASATLSRQPLSFAGELGFSFALQLVQLGNVLLAVSAPGNAWLSRLGERLFGAPGETRVEPGGPDRFSVGLALGVTLVAALLAWVVYQRHPHIPDEVVYLFHARYFAEGRMSMPLPAVPDAFSVDLMSYQTSRWFSPVPPGWPAILAIGAFLGVPWLVNPVLAGLDLLLAAGLLRELYPRRTARIATVLLAVSPWHLFMAMNFMTHGATLTCGLGAALAVARLRRDPRLRWAVLAGALIGIVSLIRPLDGLTVALLLGVWSLGAKGKRFRFSPSAAMTLSTLAVGSLVFPYNRALTGSARVFPIMQYADALYGPGTNDLGFGRNRGLGWPGMDPFPGHGLIDVVVNANFNVFQTNVELLGWATGSLLLLTAFLAGGKLRRADWQLVGAIVFIAAMQSLYWFSGGPDFGARYWYLIIVPCLALTARGLERLEARAGERVLRAAVLLVTGALLLFLPWRAVDKYYHYRGMRPDVRALAQGGRFRQGIVLVRGRRFPDYASATVYNPVVPGGDHPLYAWDRGPELRRRLAEHYPDRAFWIVEGATLTGGAARVIAGPLTPAALLARADSLPPP